MAEGEKIIFVKKEIIDKIVKGYIVGDLERMLRIPVIENSNGNCNFPIALYVFCTMDFLGYLISEIQLAKNDDIKRINTYIEMVFSAEAKAEIEPHKEVFVNKFRHGLVHQFFPKMAGIGRKNLKLFMLSEDDFWVLDADILASMFTESVKKLEELVGDEKFAIRMFDRYKQLQEEKLDLKNLPSTFTQTSSSSGFGGFASCATTSTVPSEEISWQKP